MLVVIAGHHSAVVMAPTHYTCVVVVVAVHHKAVVIVATHHTYVGMMDVDRSVQADARN